MLVRNASGAKPFKYSADLAIYAVSEVNIADGSSPLRVINIATKTPALFNQLSATFLLFSMIVSVFSAVSVLPFALSM